MFYYIYKITNILNNKFYIGKHHSININNNYFGSGKLIIKAIEKYGKENFKKDILYFCDSKELLSLKEKEIVTEELLNNELCYNLKVGGEGGFELNRQKEYSLLAKEKLKLLHKIPEWNFRKRNNMSLSQKGRPQNHKIINSPEFYKQLGLVNSIKQSGSGNSQFGTCWIYNETKNKKINKNDLNKYLEKGWIKGRKIK